MQVHSNAPLEATSISCFFFLYISITVLRRKLTRCSKFITRFHAKLHLPEHVSTFRSMARYREIKNEKKERKKEKTRKAQLAYLSLSLSSVTFDITKRGYHRRIINRHRTVISVARYERPS